MIHPLIILCSKEYAIGDEEESGRDQKLFYPRAINFEIYVITVQEDSSEDSASALSYGSSCEYKRQDDEKRG